MPVGTQGTVRALSPNDLRAAGATLVLANTYHLHVRPGEQVVEKLGALHRFMGWDRPLLTDSGGFQVFSLEGFRRVDDDGVEFQSHVDGGRRTLTPERATEIQWVLGADIAMAFDHVVPGGADEATARDAMERTLRWLERCRKRHGELVPRSVGASCNQTLWPILQGGTHLARRADAQRPERLGFHSRRSGEHPQLRAPRRPAAARRDLRLRDLHHVLARLSAPSVHGGGAPGAPAPVVAQRSLPDPARG